MDNQHKALGLQRRGTLLGLSAVTFDRPDQHENVVVGGGTLRARPSTAFRSSRPPEAGFFVTREDLLSYKPSNPNLAVTSIFDALSDGVIVLGAGDRVVFCNQAAAAVFRLTKEGIEGMRIFGLFEDCTPGPADIRAFFAKPSERPLRVTVRRGTEGDLPVLLSIAQTDVGTVVTLKDNSEAERLATIDPLTNLENRRQYEQRLKEDAERLERGHIQRLGMLFIDLDHFSRINNEHGHDVGDQVLRSVAQAISGSVRLIDTVGRYGGEEIVVLLPDADLSSAAAVAHRVLAAIRALPLTGSAGQPIGVTASIGVASASRRMTQEMPTLQAPIDTLVQRADAAMYRAKKNGRNQIALSHDEK